MKFVSRDFVKLRWRLLLTCVALLLSALLILWGLRFDKESHQQRDTAASRQKQSESKLQQVRNEEEDIRQKAALFLQLQQASILGPEKRLDWTEMLSDLQRQLRLPAMEYEFSPQTALESTSSGGYAFYKSPMKLQLGLLHEEDLLRFTTALEKQARALVLVQSCTLVRQPPASNERESNPAQLKAECELDWITARPATGNSKP